VNAPAAKDVIARTAPAVLRYVPANAVRTVTAPRVNALAAKDVTVRTAHAV